LGGPGKKPLISPGRPRPLDVLYKKKRLAGAVLSGHLSQEIWEVRHARQCSKQVSPRPGRSLIVLPVSPVDGLLLKTDCKTGKVSVKMSLGQFQRVIDIYLTGVFSTVRELHR
jgi:hypothetical protein